MIRINTILLTVSLGLIMSATAQAASSTTITQSQLPFTISTPGTYVPTGNLTCPSTNTGAINIIHNLPGAVIIDLKGFTLTGPGDGGTTAGIIIHTIEGYNSFPVTIRNGTIKNFYVGVTVGEQNDITVNNVTILEPSVPSTYQYGIIYERCNSSRVNNCTFNALVPGPTQAITD
jgi:hypothetical protein